MRQYVHVDDVADYLIALLRADQIQARACNLSSGDYRRFGEIVDFVREACPEAGTIAEGTPDLGDSSMKSLSIAAIQYDLRWTPKLSLSKGLCRCRDWLRLAE